MTRNFSNCGFCLSSYYWFYFFGRNACFFEKFISTWIG